MSTHILHGAKLVLAGDGTFFVRPAKQLRCEVEQARIRVEILDSGNEPRREETAFLGELEACEPACRLDVSLPAGEPALSRQELHDLAYLFRREAGLIHIAKPAGTA